MLSDEQRTAVNALLEELRQDSYEELLAAAKKLEEKPPVEDTPEKDDEDDDVVVTPEPEEKPEEKPEPTPDTGERAPALPWILGGLMVLCVIVCAFALFQKKK